MASHAHSPGDSVSAAKITAYCTVGVAIIGLITAAVGLLKPFTDSKGPPTNSTATTTVTPVDAGLRFSPIINGKLTVSGSAQKDVNGMYVVIGPKPSGGYDTGCGNVVNQHWQAEVPTDPSWQQYPLVTVPYYGSSCGATSASAHNASAYKFTFQGTEPTTPPPPPPPDQNLDCAAQHGPSCLTGPGFGPPSTYQPNH
jgi:hypothetical protein